MRILGIETSCDETAAAVVEDGIHVVSNVVASSQELHTKTGGIIPEQAAREQVKCMLPVLEEAIRDVPIDTIDAIAVTYGPGLIGSLLVGIETAKTLAYLWKKPLIPVNHLVGHVYANFIDNYQSPITNNQSNLNLQFSKKRIEFPAMVLIVSGGHTELVLMKGHAKFQFIGGTRDDAAGEAFDKVARILGLPYPGGPAIAKAATNYQLPITNNQSIFKSKFSNLKLPRPMMDSGDFDFSFSGLKTSVLRHFERSEKSKIDLTPDKTDQDDVSYFAYEVQEAITDVLVKKTIKAGGKYLVKSILLAGGVTANSRLREKMESAVKISEFNFNLSIPPVQLCTDNAVSIASAAFFINYPRPIADIFAEPGLEIG